MAIDLSQYKTLKEIKAYAVAQFATITQLMKEKEDLQAKVRQLELMLEKAQTQSSWVVAESQPISEEEHICIQQISYLYQASQIRPLSHEEIKSLDLLVKNVRSIRKPKEEDPLKEARKLSSAELLRIAEAEVILVEDKKS